MQWVCKDKGKTPQGQTLSPPISNFCFLDLELSWQASLDRLSESGASRFPDSEDISSPCPRPFRNIVLSNYTYVKGIKPKFWRMDSGPASYAEADSKSTHVPYAFNVVDSRQQ